MEKAINSLVLTFAVDTKRICEVSAALDISQIKTDLLKLIEWSDKSMMLFNLEKSKIMHIRGKPKIKFNLGVISLNSVTSEKDLSVMFTDSFKVEDQSAKAVKSANEIAGLIFRSIISRSKEVLLRLFEALESPKMDYCIQVWKSYSWKDIRVIEKIWNRFSPNNCNVRV